MIPIEFLSGIQVGVVLTSTIFFLAHAIRAKKKQENHIRKTQTIEAIRGNIIEALMQTVMPTMPASLPSFDSEKHIEARLTKEMRAQGPVKNISGFEWTKDVIDRWLKSYGFDTSIPIPVFKDSMTGDIVFRQNKRGVPQ